MARPVNPYVAGNPVGNSPAFVGRADVLREVLRVLRRPQDNAIVLYGQRRIGKTSILQHLAAVLPQEGPYRAVYFDLQDKAAWPLGRVLQDLARTIANARGQPDPDLGADPETAFRQEWLPAVLGDLPEGCSLVLLFDEFDVLADPQAEQAAAAFFPYLRDLLTCDPQRLQFVFVIGRNVDDLTNIALSLFKVTPARRVSLLNRKDTADLVYLSEANDTLRWPDEAVERVWQLTSGHPFLTQQLCSHVWEQVYDEEPDEPPTVVSTHVDAAVPDALEASRNALEWLWGGLRPAERIVASALAEAGAGPITEERLEYVLRESGVRVFMRELQNIPKTLQDWDILESADGGYRFRVELLLRWVADHRPLRRVYREELRRIEPVAESLYQAALGLYQRKQLKQAIRPLRQAVGLNPDHIEASQLLVDILVAQGKVYEARQLLERLYEYHPAAARSRLVQNLYDAARVAEDGGRRREAIRLYARILSLDDTYRDVAQRLDRLGIMLAEIGVPPMLLEKYLIEREVGRGAGGRVYLARDELGRPVALKYHKALTQDDQRQIERLLQEARTVANLRHPNVAIVYTTESYPESGDYCVVMEYADGGTLAHLLETEGRLSIERTLDVGIQVCTALEYVHRMGHIHRDVKPSNILFFRADDQVVAKIADFGLSRSVQVGDHRPEDQEGQVSGTWEYAAPELLRNETIDNRIDLYSLGVVLYEMLVGKPPFPYTGDVAAVVVGHLHGDVTPPQALRPAVFDELNALVLEVLAKLPSERFQDAGTMLSALRQAKDLCTQYHMRAQDSYDRGMRLEEKEDWPKAVRAFEEAYALNPELEGAEPRLKNAQLMLELEATWHETEALWADEVWADVLERLGRIGRVAPEYRAKEVEEKAKHARLQLKLASLYGDARAAEGAGRRREAIRLYVQILSLDDRYSDAAQRLARLRTEEDLENLWTRGEQLVQQEKWEEATGVYAQIIATDPDYPGAAKQLSHTRRQLELARLYSQALAESGKGDWDKTTEILREITTYEPAYKDAAIRLADASRRQRLELLRQSVEQLMEDHQWSVAAAVLEELCRFEPANEEARQQLKRVRQWQAFDDMYRRGKADYGARQWDEAIAKLEEALKIAGVAGLDLHNYRDTKLLLDRARINKELDALREKGKRLETAADFNPLIQILNQMLELAPGNQEVLDWKESTLQQMRLGNLYDQALSRTERGDWVGAKRILDEIVSVDAGYKDVKEIRKRVDLNRRVSFMRRGGFPLLIALGTACLLLLVSRLVAEARHQPDPGSLVVTPEFVGSVVSVFTLIVSMAGLLIPAEKLSELLKKDKQLRVYVVLAVLLVTAFLLILLTMALVPGGAFP